MRALAGCTLVLLAGCTGLLGIENLSGPPPVDAPSEMPADAGADGQVPPHVTVAGTIRTNLPGVPAISTPLELLRPDGSVAQSGISDQAGAFSLTLPNIDAVDLALHVRGTASLPDNYVYFSALLTGDRQLSLVMPTYPEMQQLAMQFGTNFTTDEAAVLMTILDRAGVPVAEESVTTDLTNVTTIAYPESTHAATASSGRVAIFTYLPTPLQAPAIRMAVRVSVSGPVAIAAHTIYVVPSAVHYLELRP